MIGRVEIKKPETDDDTTLTDHSNVKFAGAEPDAASYVLKESSMESRRVPSFSQRIVSW